MAQAAAETAEELAGCRLAFVASSLDLPLEPLPTREEFARDAAAWEQRAGKLAEIREAEILAIWARDMAAAGEAGRLQGRIAAEAVASSLGDCEFVTLPGEFFHELGRAIKQGRPPGKVFVLGCTGATLGYVGPPSAYAEGGYEVDESYRFYGLPARLARGAGEEVVRAALGLLAGPGGG